jgi:hypothetical protein
MLQAIFISYSAASTLAIIWPGSPLTENLPQPSLLNDLLLFYNQLPLFVGISIIPIFLVVTFLEFPSDNSPTTLLLRIFTSNRGGRQHPSKM